MRTNSPNAERYQRKIEKDNSRYLVMLAENGQTIGKSEMYSEHATTENGIKSVMTIGTTTFVKGLD